MEFRKGNNELSSYCSSDGSSERTAAENEMKEKLEFQRHVQSTAALCLCTLVHGYLLVSVFPYAGYMAIALIPGVTEETAGPFAGLIASAFMAGRSLSAYPWGSLADSYGRKFVLVASLLLSSLWSLLFGVSRTLWQAMLFRFLLGFCNCIVSTTKTMVTEHARGNEPWEKRSMGLVVGMRSWGFLISPAVAGWLAEPLVQYPESHFLARFSPALSLYPFLLPNVLGTLLCLLAILVVVHFVDETLPMNTQRHSSHIPGDLWRYLAHHVACGRPSSRGDVAGASESTLLLSLSSKDGEELKGETNVETEEETSHHSAASIWHIEETRHHLCSYWMFSFVVTCIDESFPLFCISKRGGLSLSEASIGKILSGAGLLFACLQYVVYATTVERTGLYNSLTLASALGSLPVALIPACLFLRQSSSELTWEVFLFLCILLAISKIYSCMFFTCMAIALNKTVSPLERGAMNGLAMLGASLAKGISPIFAGGLVAVSFADWRLLPASCGSLVIFTTIALLGLMVVVDTKRLKERK